MDHAAGGRRPASGAGRRPGPPDRAALPRADSSAPRRPCGPRPNPPPGWASELAGETWVGGGPASAWFRIVRHTCRAAGFDPRVALTTDDDVAVQAFAAAGLGVAVIPGLAIAHTLPHVEIRPIRGLAPVRRIWAARPRDPFCPRAARAMIDTLQLTATPGAATRGP